MPWILWIIKFMCKTEKNRSFVAGQFRSKSLNIRIKFTCRNSLKSTSGILVLVQFTDPGFPGDHRDRIFCSNKIHNSFRKISYALLRPGKIKGYDIKINVLSCLNGIYFFKVHHPVILGGIEDSKVVFRNFGII